MGPEGEGGGREGWSRGGARSLPSGLAFPGGRRGAPRMAVLSLDGCMFPLYGFLSPNR